uniref:Uncharacterized protein n=1 Tax=Timema poppense TaxID=170557 RepID=A0A7R9CWM5_TIMPO|nr:unnamed protein product [Timema poppensis]
MDNIINKNLTVHSDNYKESMFSSRIQGAPQKYSWQCKTAHEKHRTNNSEKWPNVLDELLKAELISGQQLLRLKDNHCVVTCDPNIIMDLRHEEVKKNRKVYRQGCSKHDIIEEAKRMVKNEEIEKLTQKKESNLIEKEISNFKKQLEIGRDGVHARKYSHTTINSAVLMGKPSMHYPPNQELLNNLCKQVHVAEYKKEAIKNIANIVTGNQLVIQRDSTKSLERMPTDVIYDEEPKVVCSKEKPLADHTVSAKDRFNPLDEPCSSSVKSPEATKVFQNVVGAVVDVSAEDTYYNVSHQILDNCLIIERQEMLNHAWKKWLTYVAHKKSEASAIIQTKVETKDNNPVAQEQDGILRGCFLHWRSCVRVKEISRTNTNDKDRRMEIINKFLKSIEDKKLHVETESKIEKTNHENIIKKDKENNTKKDIKPKMCKKYENRFKAQKNIIAMQKAKLEEQNKIIGELKLAKIKMETQKSTKEACLILNEAIANCDAKIKSKAKGLRLSLSVTDISRSQETLKRSDRSIHNDLPPILLNMEERRKAREQKWQLIKEKKRLIKEEREKKIQEEEEERQRKDNEAKMKRLEELREKRLREKEIALQREFEREHLKMMVIKATDHYKKYLMVKYGLRPLKKLLMLQAQQASHAELHYQKTVMNNHFQNWRTSVQTCLQQRFDKAISHYHHKLSEKCFNTWLLVYDNSIRKYQVAIDLYDLNLTARIFRDWHCYVCAQHLEMGLKHEKAVNHCKRKILVKCLRDWTKLPEVAKLEQEKEMRKNVWRKKVQEVLPDFNPPSYY